jgi:hypothetical protein
MGLVAAMGYKLNFPSIKLSGTRRDFFGQSIGSLEFTILQIRRGF